MILSDIENKKNEFEKLNVRLNYNKNNEYSLDGNIFYKEKKIKFFYDLKYLDHIINIKGFIKGKDLEVNNNTNIDANFY